MTESQLKVMALNALSKNGLTGYELVKNIEHQTSGSWVPSFGSIYPLLKEFNSKGLVKCSLNGRRKVYIITQKGRSELKTIMKKKDEMIRFIDKNIEVFLSIHGAGKRELYELVLSDLKKGKLPLQEVQPEANQLKESLLRLYSKDKLEKNSRNIKRILKKARKEIEAL